MPPLRCRCPKCSTILEIPGSASGKPVKCPKCGVAFRTAAVAPPTAPPEKLKSVPSPPRPTANPTTKNAVESVPPRKKPSPSKDHSEFELPRERRPAKSREAPSSGMGGRKGLFIVMGFVAAALLLVCAGGIAVVAFLPGKAKQQVAQRAPDTLPAGKPLVENPDTKPQSTGQKPSDPEQNPAGSPQRPVDPIERPNEPIEEPRPAVFEGPLPEISAVPSDSPPILVLDPGGHTSRVSRVLFTPDGKQIVSVSSDKMVRVWDALTGEPLRTLHLPMGSGTEGALNSLAISPDGKRIAVGGIPVRKDKEGFPTTILSLEEGKVEAVLAGTGQVTGSLAFSRDGALLAVGSLNGVVLVFQTSDWRQTAELTGHTAGVNRLAFGPTNRQLASVSNDKTVRLWNLSDPKTHKILATQEGGCYGLAWSRDGKMIATSSADGSIRFWTETGEAIDGLVIKHDNTITEITSLDLSSDGTSLVYGGIDRVGRVGIIDLASRRQVLDFTRHENTVVDVRFSPDGKRIVSTGGNDHESFVWKAEDGKVQLTLQGAGKSVWGLGWSEDGKSIAWSTTNRFAGEPLKEETKLERSFRLDTLELGDSPEGNFKKADVERGGYSLKRPDFRRLQVFQDGKPTIVLESPFKVDRLRCASITSGERVIVGSSQGLFLMDLRTGKLLRRFEGHMGEVMGISPSPDDKYFATGSGDQTVRIWSTERETALLSLFVVGNEWIAWTPEGYYAASPNGERLMGWQVNNGLDRIALYYPAVQFRASLYQPELIRRLLPAGSVAEVVAQAAREGKPLRAAPLEQVLPPAVAITSPTPIRGGAVPVNGGTVEVKAVARSSGNHPVTALRLLLDGRPYQGQKGLRSVEKPRLGAVGATWKVAVPPGRHVLAVQAESEVSKGLSAAVEVAAADSAELPNLYMVAIGVSAYPGKARLQFAASDAELMAQTFRQRSAGVFKKIEAHVVVDRAATRAGILKELDWLASVMTPSDVAIISFSGHGARDRSGTFYLVPVDAMMADAARTCVSGDVLKARLGAMPGQVIAMLDACHSGTVAEDMHASRPDNLVRDLVTDDYGVVVMCSSLGREYSLESSETKAGFFTLGITEGLAGEADYNKDGIVFLHELDRYAAVRVKQLSDGKQNPVTGRPPTIRTFPLSKPSG